MRLDVLEMKEADLSQLKPSTFSLHRQCPVLTSHSCVLPAGLHEHGLGMERWGNDIENFKATDTKSNGFAYIKQCLDLNGQYLQPASVSVWYPGWHLSHLSPITPGLHTHRPVLSH